MISAVWHQHSESAPTPSRAQAVPEGASKTDAGVDGYTANRSRPAPGSAWRPDSGASPRRV